MITRAPENDCSPIQGSEVATPGSEENYRYEAYVVTGNNIEALRKRALPIYLTFRHDYFTAVDRIRGRITEEAILRIAMTPRGRSVGFIAYTMTDVLEDNRHLVVADIATIVVEPAHEKKGIGTRLFKDIAEENFPDAFTGVVQEPYTHRAKLKTGYCDMKGRQESDVYPLEVVRPLIKVLEIKHRTAQVTDWKYGICAGYFPLDERARRLKINRAEHPEAYDIYEAWLRTGFRPEDGDGKRYWLPTIKEKIIPRTPRYRE